MAVLAHDLAFISLAFLKSFGIEISYLQLGLYRINFFPIRPEPDFAGFGMTNPAGAGTGFSN